MDSTSCLLIIFGAAAGLVLLAKCLAGGTRIADPDEPIDDDLDRVFDEMWCTCGGRIKWERYPSWEGACIECEKRYCFTCERPLAKCDCEQ